ncbi:beta-1,4 N-acetylgalactosaminyltransferase 2-like [Engraulis encrasicolus]|uniref:beta-1,4 N-acetylgalactosaminyltransferase 2-like n=1 Tax=Engraulis encrasicolus TaxID=184585 RepID=UPI002FCFE7BB
MVPEVRWDVKWNGSVETDPINNTRILERHLPSPSCSCPGKNADIISSVEAKMRTFTMKRRAEEHEKQQIRDSTGFAGVLISPPNSPLQYPSHGVTVEPLKTTLLPGLAVHTQEGGKVFKVSLHASHGVMAVQGAPQEQGVRGQNQSVLDISATSLAHLNELLAQVTYCSTAYHLHMEDLVHFSFEDHEVVFPVTVKRSSIPVLYDLGEDINSQVTIAVKTFLRYKELRTLIESIRVKYPHIRIIIADDSKEPEKVEGHNIYQYIMPPAQGWFAGRNLAISQVTTKYFLWVDDDFLFLNETSIEKFVEIMEAVPKLDVLGGSVGGDRFYFTLEHQEGAEGEGGCLSRRRNKRHGPLPGFKDSFFGSFIKRTGVKDCVLVDGVVNYFLARTDAVRKVGFDPMLQRTAHSEFFMDGLGRLLVASCKGLVIGHQKPQSNPQYKKFRNPGRGETTNKLRLHYFKNHLKCVAY